MKSLLGIIVIISVSSIGYGQTKNKKAKLFYDDGMNKIIMKDYSAAISDFTEALKLDPGFIQAYENRGVAKFYIHDHRGAIADYSEALKINPDDYNTLGRRGWAKFFIFDYKGAVSDLTRAIEGSEDKAKYYNVRGEARYHLKDFNGAMEDFNKVIKSWSSGRYNRSKAYYLKGLVEVGQGQKEAGCLDLHKAGKLGYSDAGDAIKLYCCY